MPLDVPAIRLAELATQITIGKEDRARPAACHEWPLFAVMDVGRGNERIHTRPAGTKFALAVKAAVPPAQPAVAQGGLCLFDPAREFTRLVERQVGRVRLRQGCRSARSEIR